MNTKSTKWICGAIAAAVLLLIGYSKIKEREMDRRELEQAKREASEAFDRLIEGAGAR